MIDIKVSLLPPIVVDVVSGDDPKLLLSQPEDDKDISAGALRLCGRPDVDASEGPKCRNNRLFLLNNHRRLYLNAVQLSLAAKEVSALSKLSRFSKNDGNESSLFCISDDGDGRFSKSYSSFALLSPPPAVVALPCGARKFDGDRSP